MNDEQLLCVCEREAMQGTTKRKQIADVISKLDT